MTARSRAEASAEPPIPSFDATLVEAIAERVAEIVYHRLRADWLMGDDATVSKDEMTQIFHRNRSAAETWQKIGVGPQGIRSAGAREVIYRIGAIRHYMNEIRAGAMHITPFLEAQAKLEASGWGRTAAAE